MAVAAPDSIGIRTVTPYPGLRPFKEEESAYFFGQDIPLADLRDRLDEAHFVAILGLSGCGKSSPLRAGLLADVRPMLVEGPRRRWLIGEMQPGDDPLGNLIAAVNKVNDAIALQRREFGGEEPMDQLTLDAALVKDGFGLAHYGHKAPLHQDQRILIVVDQFEELFRYQKDADSPEERGRAALFVQLLLEAARDKDCRVSIVITMRSEFLGDCALFFGLAERVNLGTFLLPRMTRDQLEDVIVGPAEKVKFEIDAKVVQELLNETEQQDDGLPLLQHALRRIYRNWDRRGREGPIGVQDLYAFRTKAPEAVAAIKHHLDDHLNSIYGEFTEAEKDAAELMFRMLWQRDPKGRVTRRPLKFETIVEGCGKDREAALRGVVEAFRNEREGRTFMTPESPKPLEGKTIDISHECLLRRWELLGGWIKDEERDAKEFIRLAEDADEADLRCHDSKQPTMPLQGANLEHFRAWRKKATLVSPGWALRYVGKDKDKEKLLGRPPRSFERGGKVP